MSARCMPFGKFKGWLLEDLPDWYIPWILANIDLREPLRSGIEREYQRREAAEEQTDVVPAELIKMAEQIVSVGYRSLALKCHPDAGGDHRTMAGLNAAVAFLRKNLERSA
jgi:hypothetical protein